ncbi:Alkaline phosphatase synthesis sensor protein PhoR [Planctomycetes bacterium Pan216]|uniref:histidine kinase n=1 Tax=Kolteria novifilia TaxID=2527975 RepID=A0A518BA91_9BACT|nr:Alkaline phosphatase synthesis sensor protein PhoR [Planctomycetes bacterium Pan216]
MFWKLFGPFAALTIVGLAVFATSIRDRLGAVAVSQAKESLRTTSSLIAPQLAKFASASGQQPSQATLDRLASDISARISLFDQERRLLADSSPKRTQDSAETSRPELDQASRSGFGSILRPDRANGERQLFVARRLELDGVPVGFVRLSVPLASLRTQETGVWRTAAAIGMVLLVSGAACSWFLLKSWQARLDGLTARVQAVASGEHDISLDLHRGDELDSLSHALEKMRATLIGHWLRTDRVKHDLQAMLETMPEGIIAIDVDQQILFANPTFYRLFGLPRSDAVGRKLWEIVRHPALHEAVARTFNGNAAWSTEFEVLSPHRLLTYFSRPISLASGAGSIIVLRDVSELRRLENVRQEFVANASHELKTPLTAIKAFAETILESDPNDVPQLRHFLERINRQADRLSALILDMLTLARCESHAPGFEIQSVSLRHIVAACVDQFREKAEGKSLALRAEVADDADEITADAEGAATILRNLLENATKYTPEGGRIAIWTERVDEGIALQVSDTGVGIPERDLDRIFERFYRVDKARSSELGGTGLGLSIVKHLAQSFGGSVSVTSRLNEGSVFRVIFRPSDDGEMAANASSRRDSDMLGHHGSPVDLEHLMRT